MSEEKKAKAVQEILDQSNKNKKVQPSLAKKIDKKGPYERFDHKALIENSPAFVQLQEEVRLSMKQTLTGMVNLVVDHEEPVLVKEFLKYAFNSEELFNNTYKIDAVELQQGQPGKGVARSFLDRLIYGSFETTEVDEGIVSFKINNSSGERERQPNGLVNRKKVKLAQCKDKNLIINGIDYSLDFCQDGDPGLIDTRGLWIFDRFRDATTRMQCKILLVSNVPLKFPFKIPIINFQKIDTHEANVIINKFIDLYHKNKYTSLSFSSAQREQISRKIMGLTYTEGGDALANALAKNRDTDNHTVDTVKVLVTLREKINSNFMADGFGLRQLTPRAWEDYICPESSNFTFDVKNIMRDFTKIKEIRERMELGKSKDDAKDFALIDAIQTRIPHVIILHGKGGVGKCLGKGTKVIMLDGSKKNVEDVVKGDLLLGPDSKHRTVLSTTSGSDQLYKVTQKNGKDYICNGSHILSLKAEGKDKDTPIFISAEDYLEQHKTWQKTHYGWKSGVEFNERQLPIDPYWLGLWLGDGTSEKPAITVGTQDKKTINWLTKWAKNNALFVREETKKNSSAVTLNFSARIGSGYSQNFVKKALRDMDVLGNKHIPELYKINSEKNRLKLLAGLIDSDGYKSKTGSIHFYNINKRLAADVADLGRSLGFKVFETSSVKSLKSHNYKVLCYIVTFGGNLSRIPVRLSRKKGHDNTQKVGVKCGIKVTPVNFGEYYGFTLDGDKQFLLEDYTVTHNSAFPVHLAGLLDFDIWDFNINAVHTKWLGESSEKMRKSLDKIMSSSHTIIRIDEYDRAMGSSQESGEGMHSAHKQVESEIMNWLQNSQDDNEFQKKSIFVVMTTNHKENITGPMLRSGRADLVIDIDNFDAASMELTFKTCARRMDNRGIKAVDYPDSKDLQEAIDLLDLGEISELCTEKGFTVRDVEMLIIEMAAHDFYHKQGEEGIEWNTENFVKVLKNSQGSTRANSTGELILGDRMLLMPEEEVEEELQEKFDFEKNHIYDKTKIGEIPGFKKI